MGVIQCEECTYAFSDKRDFCPKCGCPKHIEIYNNISIDNSTENQKKDDKMLLKAISCVIATIIVVCILNLLPGGSWENTDKAGITLSNYNKIQTDMQYSQVADILGSKGKLITSNKIATMNIETQCYTWRSKLGFKRIVIVFKNDKVIFKIQKGLE